MTKTIDRDVLIHVTGAAGTAPVVPINPGPFTLPNGQAPPKYSARWWDAARASGVLK